MATRTMKNTMENSENMKYCGHCGKKFTEIELERHEMTHSGAIPRQSNNEKPFSCSKCDKKFVAHSDLKSQIT